MVTASVWRISARGTADEVEYETPCPRNPKPHAGISVGATAVIACTTAGCHTQFSMRMFTSNSSKIACGSVGAGPPATCETTAAQPAGGVIEAGEVRVSIFFQ